MLLPTDIKPTPFRHSAYKVAELQEHTTTPSLVALCLLTLETSHYFRYSQFSFLTEAAVTLSLMKLKMKLKKLEVTDFYMKYVSYNITKAFLGPLKDMNGVNFDSALFGLSRTFSISKQTSQVLSYTLWPACKSTYAYNYG